MYHCEKLYPEMEISKNKLISFLKNFDLEYEDLETAYIITDDNNKWLACGGRSQNVLKCFAVLDDYRNEGLFDLILSSLIKESFKKEIDNLFVFTKLEYTNIFKNFGFELLASTNMSSILLRRDGGAISILDSLNLDIENFNKIGSVVINANPFTNGHRYLIEYSSNIVDLLIVFVVENDHSYFKFKDRYEMVKLGTKDIDNIKILPSTDLIISEATFPSYFLKEERIINIEHAKLDSKIFKKYFVPKFNINTRFLGSEPIDKSTNIYNKILSEILPPECNIHVVDRLMKGDEIVSASIVRKLIKEDNFNKIKEYVPSSVYDYLRNII